MRVRTILGSTAFHATVACGLGVWVGAFAGSNPRPEVTFGIAYEPRIVVEEREMPEEPIEDVVVETDTPMPEPELPRTRRSEFEAPDAPRDVEAIEAEATPTEHLLVRVRPTPLEPVVEKPPVEKPPVEATPPAVPVFVEAKARDERNAPPAYPRASVRRGECGEVILLLTINPEGIVMDVRLDNGCGYPRLHDAAIEAAWKWTFDPATEDGEPVTSTKRVPVEFRIQ